MAGLAQDDDRLAQPCPCGAGPTAAECCVRYFAGDGEPASPPTAEALMRSRYTAYALGVIDHIMATHHPQAGGDVDRKSTEKWSREAKWLGLDVVSTEAGGEGDETGEVEFIARYELSDTPLSHHERAQFRRHQGRWYYWDGAMVRPRPVVREQPKVGRNDPCPCGSGSKYKKCHGAGA
ncbi:MAG TPA: YchJ family protein [Kofleriaceae bacterium]|nr:YchJ family protein [Kofleriaceae bacterium]